MSDQPTIKKAEIYTLSEGNRKLFQHFTPEPITDKHTRFVFVDDHSYKLLTEEEWAVILKDTGFMFPEFIITSCYTFEFESAE